MIATVGVVAAQPPGLAVLLGGYRRYLGGAALISFGVNLLVLVPAIYALVVFDRVLTSRSEETLVVISVGAVAALLFLFVLDYLRARLLGAMGLSLDRSLGPGVIRAVLERAARRRGDDPARALRDLATLRAFLLGNGVLAVFDAPWLPIYLVIIGLFHPLLGLLATAGAVLLLLVT